MWRQVMPALRITLAMTVLTGLVYPALVTGIAQVAFRRQADGSLIVKNGRVIGSEWIGQTFTRPEYFHSRPSAAGEGYDAAASGGSSLGPTSSKLLDRVKHSVAAYRAANPEAGTRVPADAVLASASGLDPHITPDNAALQAARVAKARGVHRERVVELLRQMQETRDLGLLGEPRVNVLRFNLALDERFPMAR
ncbi:MAG: K(+)-transporting ATPase subunit C [Acidobacteriales bacterium]|nr:K(+)-transporting ATPase subunit C [Terriglobales bacterium]